MSADELIHLISNKALNKTLKENDKLVIQDCCKELFNKKEETIDRFRRITYLKSKAYFNEDGDALMCSARVKKRIVEVIDRNISDDREFPEVIRPSVLTMAGTNYITINSPTNDNIVYTILEIKDI